MWSKAYVLLLVSCSDCCSDLRLALKKRFFPAKKQILSPVQPSPTISDWQPAANLETQGENRISTWGDRRLFSEFRGILSDDTDPKNQIVPEDLPMHDGEMFFGSITPAVAQLLPESAARRATQRKNLMAAGYQSRLVDQFDRYPICPCVSVPRAHRLFSNRAPARGGTVAVCDADHCASDGVGCAATGSVFQSIGTQDRY